MRRPVLPPTFVAARTAWSDLDREWAERVHHCIERRVAIALLEWVSRLGDGMLWYLIIGLLALIGGPRGRLCAVQMVTAGFVCLVTYKALKRWASRPRPFECCPGIQARSYVLDRFSFPSGHTLHAVGFTLMLTFHYPLFGAVLWVFTALVAFSRVVLGLHYPSDVLAGALVGATVSSLVSYLM